MDRNAIEDQIERLLNCAELDGKEQLKRLLGFLFERMESQAALQPARVIEELWPHHSGRKKTSSDLATVMSRLRRAIQAHYASAGKRDPIRIELPDRTVPSTNGTRGNRWITAEACPSVERLTPAEVAVAAAIETSHPVVSGQAGTKPWNLSFILIGAAVLGLGLLAALSAPVLEGNRAPQGVRMEGSVLTVLDGKGKELWHKSFPEGFWQDYYQQGVAARTWFGDLEGNGRTEILFLYHPSVNPRSHSTTLICYTDRGEERWRWTPGRALPEISFSPTVFETLAFAVTRATRASGARIILSSYHLPYYPNQIAVVDTNGKLISEYWHSGHLDYMNLADVDGDGKQEIVASGISNGYRQATLVVLDVDHASGASVETARPELQLHGMTAVRERFRILFPRSDLNKALSTYNRALEPEVKNGRIQIPVDECDQRPDCDVYYEFDNQLTLLSVKASDGFRSAHAEFFLKSRNNHKFSKSEEDRFRVLTCLSGCNVNVPGTDKGIDRQPKK